MAHILVVDDETDLTALYQTFLEASGYRVTVAHDGVTALLADEEDQADAVIADLTMPRMDGRELIARLRERRPHLPAIIVSGYVGAVDLDSRETTILTKPVSLALLIRKLATLLGDDEKPS